MHRFIFDTKEKIDYFQLERRALLSPINSEISTQNIIPLSGEFSIEWSILRIQFLKEFTDQTRVSEIISFRFIQYFTGTVEKRFLRSLWNVTGSCRQCGGFFARTLCRGSTRSISRAGQLCQLLRPDSSIAIMRRDVTHADSGILPDRLMIALNGLE